MCWSPWHCSFWGKGTAVCWEMHSESGRALGEKINFIWYKTLTWAEAAGFLLERLQEIRWRLIIKFIFLPHRLNSPTDRKWEVAWGGKGRDGWQEPTLQTTSIYPQPTSFRRSCAGQQGEWLQSFKTGSPSCTEARCEATELLSGLLYS